MSIRSQSALPAVIGLAISVSSLTRRQKLGIAAAVTSVGLLYVTPIVIAARAFGVVNWTAYQASFVLDHDCWLPTTGQSLHAQALLVDIWAYPALAIVVLAFSVVAACASGKNSAKDPGALLVVFLPYALLSWTFLTVPPWEGSPPASSRKLGLQFGSCGMREYRRGRTRCFGCTCTCVVYEAEAGVGRGH